jgi:hypothetical protein
MHHNLLWEPGGSARIKWGSTATVYNISVFQALFPGQGAGCIDADPLLVDPDGADFRLQPGSPAIGAGLVDGQVYGADVYQIFRDLYGRDIANGYGGCNRPPAGHPCDMGAHQTPVGE